MRYLIIILSFILLSSCENDSKNDVNKVIMLKVDYETYKFEGGKEYEFSPSQSFTISSSYTAPKEVGSIRLYYSELNEMLFNGTIISSDVGEVIFPKEINPPNTFAIIDESIELPGTSTFQKVMYNQYQAYYPETIDYTKIWNSLENLKIVQEYRDANAQGKIYLFLYTPIVGIADLSYWDWYVFMKN